MCGDGVRCEDGLRMWSETRGSPGTKLGIIRSPVTAIKMSHRFASAQHSSQRKELNNIFLGTKLEKKIFSREQQHNMIRL